MSPKEKTLARMAARAAKLKNIDPVELADMAAAYIRKIPAGRRRDLLKMTVAELAAAELFSREVYGI